MGASGIRKLGLGRRQGCLEDQGGERGRRGALKSSWLPGGLRAGDNHAVAAAGHRAGASTHS